LFKNYSLVNYENLSKQSTKSDIDLISCEKVKEQIRREIYI